MGTFRLPDKEKIRSIKQRNLDSMMAARGGGKRSDLSQIDQLVDAISSKVGEGKQFSSFSDAYDAITKQDVKLPSKNVLRGRALRRIDWLDESGKIKDREKLLKSYGIADSDLKDGYERFAGGAAQEVNKLDFARNKVANLRNKGMDTIGVPKSIQYVINKFLPGNNLLGQGSSESEMKVMEDTDKILTDEEQFWKGYNANSDVEAQGGLDLPLNLLGGAGGLLPDLLAGFGSGMVGKKVATQLLAETGASVGMETAKYQMEGDLDKSISSVVGDLLLNAVTMRGGSALANTLDRTKAGRETSDAMTTGDTQAAIEGMSLMGDNKSKIPSLLISDPAKAGSKITRSKSAQQVLDIKKAFGEAEAKVATDVDSALDGITPSVDTKKSNLEGTDVKDPVALDFANQTNKTRDEFRARAKPFADAYQAVGKDITIDINELLQEGAKITDPVAIERFNSIIKGNINLNNEADKIKLLNSSSIGDLKGFREKLATDTQGMKDVYNKFGVKNLEELRNAKGIGEAKFKQYSKQQEELANNQGLNEQLTNLEKPAKIGDRTAFSANEVDLITQQLRGEISGNASAMKAIGDPGIAQLQSIRGGLKEKLNNLPEEFSGNYKQAKAIYSDMFKTVGDNTVIGDVSKARKMYKENGSLEGFRSIINSNPVFDSLSTYASVLPKDSDAYKSIFREGFDNKLEGVRDAKGSSVFDFKKYGDALKGTNWEEVMRYAPEGAEESVKTLSGYQSLISRMENKGGDLLTDSFARNEALDKSSSSGLFNPKTWGGTIAETASGAMPMLRPWYKETDIGLGASLAGQLNSMLPSGSRQFIMESADSEKGYFTNQLNNLREAKGMGRIKEEPIIPELFDKLTNSDFNFKGE